MLNTITIMGRLVRDPELRNAGQHRVVNFTLAADRDYGGDDRETDFIDCVAWNAQADFISKYFSKLREKYLANGLLNPKVLKVDANTLLYQVPGGMLSNLISQLKQQNAEDKYYDVLAEVPRVRKDFGYPPLVTPTSQIVGTQAVYNVIMGERYKMVTKEFKGLVKGEYGKTPLPIDPEFRKQISCFFCKWNFTVCGFTHLLPLLCRFCINTNLFCLRVFKSLSCVQQLLYDFISIIECRLAPALS